MGIHWNHQTVWLRTLTDTDIDYMNLETLWNNRALRREICTHIFFSWWAPRSEERTARTATACHSQAWSSPTAVVAPLFGEDLMVWVPSRRTGMDKAWPGQSGSSWIRTVLDLSKLLGDISSYGDVHVTRDIYLYIIYIYTDNYIYIYKPLQ